MDEQNENEQLEPEAQHAKKVGTVILAIATVLLICASAAAVFFVIASLATGNWGMFALALAVMVVLIWCVNRFVRAAANSQTKETLNLGNDD